MRPYASPQPVAGVTAGVEGAAAEQVDLVHGAAVGEVALRAEVTYINSKSLVLGLARADEQLKVDRAPIRALAAVAVKAKRAYDETAKQAAQQGGWRA